MQTGVTASPNSKVVSKPDQSPVPNMIERSDAASVCSGVAQSASALSGSLPLLFAGRAACGLGFGLANTALNLAAGRTAHLARAISIGVACQTML